MLSNGFLKKISDFIKDRQLLSKDGKYIVALSGGADSVYFSFGSLRIGLQG